MKFSFSTKLKELPYYIQGIDRVAEINRIISENPDYRLEAQKTINTFLNKMIELEASDIDFGGMGANRRVWYRVFSRKFPFNEFSQLEHDDSTALICSILSEKKIDSIILSQNADFSYQIEQDGLLHRFRADAYMDLDFLACNFRHINPQPFTMESLGFPAPIVRKLDLDFEKKGLILVTGITGSGKSTTLDAIINMNNNHNEGHVTIIGSPIEFFHKSNKCIVRHREVGRDTLSFKDGTIESLRQDPDIIVIGEMRDPDTIMTALEITDSGHKVFSTLHTGSASESIHRIVAECPVEEQQRVRMRLADVLSVVISQKLVPSTDGKRIMAKEILNVTANVAAAIINNNVGEIYQMITEGKDLGMVTMEQDLLRLYMNKIITRKNAIAYANNKKRMVDLIQYYQNKMA
ncbi:MAG: type IV pilus twitching motility protein PilT [Candidatus Cloacimonetes bacterium]|nr:type IV pilus twitching motility protein PilT [Candidatus Cloacimonadota bacterium]